MARRRNREQLLYIREFLNQPGFHSVAVVFAKADQSGEREPNLTLMISDCNRQVSLALETYNQDEYVNTIHKLDTLSEAVKKLLKIARRDYRRRYVTPNRGTQ